MSSRLAAFAPLLRVVPSIPGVHRLLGAPGASGASGTSGTLDTTPAPAPDDAPRFTLGELAGRLVELASPGRGALLTLAFALVVDAQRAGEPVAWLSPREATFFPPDAAAFGADLAALVVVRTPDAVQVPRAADQLARAGAFGLLVLDLAATPDVRVPPPLVARLGGLAQKHGTTILCLTDKPQAVPSLGPMVSLRADVACARAEDGSHTCTLTVARDKRRAPGWRHLEPCHGPLGLR